VSKIAAMKLFTNLRRRTTALSGGLAIALLIIAGCGRSPSETVKQFAAAGKAMDTDKMKTLLSKDSVAKMGPILDMAKSLKAANKDKTAPTPDYGDVTVKSEDVTGDKATVTAVATEKDGTKHESKINLVKEDGEWKIDLGAMGGFGK
jgi:hypothetical protein